MIVLHVIWLKIADISFDSNDRSQQENDNNNNHNNNNNNKISNVPKRYDNKNTNKLTTQTAKIKMMQKMTRKTINLYPQYR